jgi:ligand-binding sensor domain-containing protein/signal transduction histidine kinase
VTQRAGRSRCDGSAGRRHGLTRCLAGLALLLSGAALAADGSGFETVRFRALGIEQGLSQATVRAITQDRAGFIWLGTQDGLNRYDGYEFRVFRRVAGDPRSLPDNHVSALAADRDGRLWVGTQNGGLARLDEDGEGFRHWRGGDAARGELAADPVHALLAHRSGGLWVASGVGQLQSLASEEAPLRDHSGAQAAAIGNIRALREGADGSVLVAASGGIWRLPHAGAALEAVLPPGRPTPDAYDVVEAFDGSLWVATHADGVLQIRADGRPGRVLGLADGLADANTRALTIDRTGRLWIGSLGGLSRWNPVFSGMQVWRGDTPGIPDGLSSPRVHALFEDRDGLLWVGTWLNGVNLHDPRTEAFAVARPDPGNPAALPGWAVLDLADAGNGQLWVSVSDRNVLVRLDPARGVVEAIAQQDGGLPPGQLRAVAQTGDGALWVAMGRHGLARRAPGEGFELLDGAAAAAWNAPDGELYELHVDARGELWVGSIGGGLARLCAGCRRFERYRHDPADPASLPGDEVTSVLAVADGSVWVGTRHAGAARLDPASGRFQRLRVDEADPDALGHAYVTSFLEDRDGELWLGTQGAGLHWVQRDARGAATRLLRFDRAQGLAADAVGGILQGGDGRLWVSTTAGLSRLDPGSGWIDNLGVREGALSAGYFIGAALALGDGRLAFGGPRGLTLFDPRDVQLPPPDPRQVVVSEVRVFAASGTAPAPRIRREADGQPRLSLVEAQNDFALDLSALTYASPDHLIFEYRLQPMEEWKRTDARRRFAAYTGVPPGEYLFRARARRPNGGPSEELQLAIRIEPQRSALERLRQLALPLSGLLGGVLLWLAWQRQRERARAQARLAASESRLKLALWGTGDELWDLDLRSNRLHRENPLPQIGASAASVVDNAAGLQDFIHPDDRPGFAAALRRLLRGEAEHFDAVARVRDAAGRWAWLRARGRVVERDARGHALRLTGTTSNISELKESEQALAAINRDLEQRVAERTEALSSANRELAESIAKLQSAQRQLVEQEKMAALGGLVAGVAHEINTPLGIGVTAASHLEQHTRRFRRGIEQGKVTRSALQEFIDVAEESADLILRNLHRADSLIKSFKQVAVDQSSEARRRIDLAGYVEEILTALRPSLRKSRHEVQVAIAPGIVIETLPGAIYQVLANLIGNSLLHGFAGRDGGGRIDIAASLGGDWVEIDYRDDGVGMDEEARRRVFEPFFTTRRGSGGSGLGMHIVYNLVTQALGGSIRCESAPGQGVRFVILLPGDSAPASHEPERG